MRNSSGVKPYMCIKQQILGQVLLDDLPLSVLRLGTLLSSLQL